MYDDDDRKKESVATTIHSFLGIFLPDKFGFCGGGGCWLDCGHVCIFRWVDEQLSPEGYANTGEKGVFL